MNRTGLLGSSALRSIAFLGLAIAGASPALAQETPAEEDAPETLQSEAEIESGTDATAEGDGTQNLVVTGSRIRRPNLESTIPITSVGGEEFFQTGQTSVGDVLNELPALRSTFSQANSSRFLGTAGLNLLDLRGLGTQRTLVLQNGRRHVPGDILNTAASVDVNTIPTDLIERVDVVTGGNSAIYGSDAIAGVVNFILKRDFEGLQLRGQGGVSKYGDAGNYFVSALAGTNFGDGRGNIALNLEYAKQNEFFGSGRPNLRQTSGFIVVDTDPASAPSDNNPDRTFFQDIRNALFSETGTFLGFNSPFFNSFLFQPNGTLIPQTGTRIGIPPFGSFTGGNGSNFREGRQFGLSPNLNRYSANLIGHFEISPAFVPFIEAKYVRTESLGNASGPFFFSGGTTGSPRERFTTQNPFLNPQAAGVIRAAYGDYYGDYDAGGNPIGNGVNDADEFGFTFIRSVTELSNREEDATRETIRIVAGTRGEFNGDWSYEVSANYGQLKEDTTILGNVNLQRFLLAIDAVRAPNGTIVCRSQIDPAARVALEVATNAAFAQQQLAADVAACVPINLFGTGNITPEARSYLLQDSEARGKLRQFVVNAFMSGDSSDWFELPGGPLGFAIGAEYRRETAFYTQDEFTQAGLTFYNAIPDFDPPSFEVKEAFAEIRLPVLAEVPFFHELTVSAAGRVSDYKGATGTVYAYNAGVDWAPVRDLRLRANFSRAVRAPNLTDLFTPLGQNFAPPPNDPCSLRNIGTGSSTREANCRAAGVPTNFDFVYQQSLGFLSGGNPDLQEETSDSFTVGGVFQPRFLPGFALSVDYFDIQVDDVITSPSAQQILDACYDAESTDNQFCELFTRAGAGGGPRGEIPGQILENSLQVVPLNYAKLKVRGLDVEASYRRRLGNIGNLSTRVNYTRVFQNDQFLNPVDPDRADQILFELGDPRDAVNWNVDLKTGPFTFGYQMRYIGKMLLNGAQFEDFFSKQDRPAQNPDFADRRFYPEIFYHDVRIGIDAGDKFNFYVGVDDITNRKPPLGQSGIGGGSGIFRNIGTFFYAGAVAKF
jgi:outer membrane receptor protein involved in Fe transport